MKSIFAQLLVVTLCVDITAFQFRTNRNTNTRSLGRETTKMNSMIGRNLEINIDGNMICYDYMQSSSKAADAAPIVYLPGLFFKKNEAKSISLQSWCKKNDYSFLCADYYGVGRSSGKFTEGTVTQWVKDTIYMLENVLGKPNTPPQKAILVGHGVGTWISFLVASKRPDLVRGIVGMASDPDFTEELLWKKLPEDIKNKIMTEGQAEISWGVTGSKYLISRALIEDGRKNLILTDKTAGSLPVKCPVRLMHAIDDDEVPFSYALQLVKSIASADANVVLLKASTHAMDHESDLHTLRYLIEEVMTDSRQRTFDLRSPASG